MSQVFENRILEPTLRELSLLLLLLPPLKIEFESDSISKSESEGVDIVVWEVSRLGFPSSFCVVVPVLRMFEVRVVRVLLK